MEKQVFCRFCRFFGEPEKIKIAKKKPLFELTCSRCGNVIGNRYIPKSKAERSVNYEQ